MSSTAKIVWAIIITAALGAGYWFWTVRESASPPAYTKDATSNASPSDTSDQALDEDTVAIDAQLNAAGSDSATANGTLNDKPIAQ